MERKEISPNYEYLYFGSQKEFFEVLDEYLLDGYRITDSIHLCVEVTKGHQSYLLSYIKVPNVDEHIKEELKKLDKKHKIVFPNYNQCILNTIASIQKKLGKAVEYKTDCKMYDLLSQNEFKHIILLLLDGLGENILENDLSKESFLKKHHMYTNTAIFPSTTAAATTSTINGLAPIRTAWLGWENWFREINKNICLFNGNDYVTGEPTGFSTYKALPYSLFHKDLVVIQPDFSKEKKDIHDVLKKSLELAKTKEQSLQYVYFTQPDSIMHEFGAYSQSAKDILKSMDEAVLQYAEALPKDTLLLITADHGHTDALPIQLWACPTIQRMLNRMPSNDARCITFSVKEEYKACFEQTFKDLFGYAYDIYPTSLAIEKGFFGKEGDPIHPRVKDFLADFVAVGVGEYYFNYKGEADFLFKSLHAGMTADEMLVPVIIYRK